MMLFAKRILHCSKFLPLMLYFSFALAVAAEVEHHKLVDHYAEYPVINFPVGETGDTLRRGEYLTKAGDCIACHTMPNSPAFAGGSAINTPFGSFYGPNITADDEYGIGLFTDDEFVRAVQDGVKPDGSFYFPVLPYIYYNKMSRDDILAIKAYLHAIPKVHKPSRPHEVMWPFSIREAQLVWRILFFYPYSGLWQPSPDKNKSWNRASYLIEGPGHCGMCHTPINILGAPKRDLSYTGNMIDGYYAPNITENTFKAISEDGVVEIFTHDKLPGGGTVSGPMREVNHDSLVYLELSDLHDIAAYLKQLPDPTPALAPGSASGKKIYQQYCSSCHTSGAAGAPMLTDAERWNEILNDGVEVVYQNAIHGIGAMPAKGLCASCSDDDIKSTVDYMLGIATGTSISSSAKKGPKPKEATLDRGELVYEKVCSSCHSNGLMGAPKLGDDADWQPYLKHGIEPLFAYAIEAYSEMPKVDNVCYTCSNADIIAAVKYMVQNSQEGKDYKLW